MSELHVRNIVNDIQLQHGIHLSGEMWDKIRQGIQGAVQVDRETISFERDMYKKAYENQLNAAFELNEFRRWIRDNPKATRKDIIQMIVHQEMNGVKSDLRNIKVK